jgi:hypothetical protein
MEGDELRERAVQSLARQRRFSVLFAAYFVASLALIAIWGLTGDGYFWPGWAIVVAALAFLAAGIARSWSDRSFSEVTVRSRMAQLSGRAPSGVQR